MEGEKAKFNTFSIYENYVYGEEKKEKEKKVKVKKQSKGLSTYLCFYKFMIKLRVTNCLGAGGLFLGHPVFKINFN